MAFHHTQTEAFRDEHMPKPKAKNKESVLTIDQKVALYRKRTTRDTRGYTFNKDGEKEYNNEDW